MRILQTLVLAFIFSAAVPAAAQTSSQDSLAQTILNYPKAYRVKTGADGSVAWVERAGPVKRLLVARPPAYETVELVRYGDTGDRISIIGFDAKGGVVFRRGTAGFDPAHRPSGPPVNLQVAREGSGTPRVLISDVSDGFAHGAISPDGRRLIYARGGDVHALDLSRPRRDAAKLFVTRGQIGALVFSPDGKRVAFQSDRSGFNRGKYTFIGVYDFDEDTITYMEPGLGIDQDIAWSPDSQRIAFVRFGFEPRTWRFSNHREGAPFDVIVADAATGAGQAVFSSKPGYGSRFFGYYANGYWGTGGRGSLVWLNSDQLLFPSEATGWRHITAVSANGGEPVALTSGKFEVSYVDPMPDRSGVLFLANSESDVTRLKLYQLTEAGSLKPNRVKVGKATDMPRRMWALPNGAFAYDLASERSPHRLMVRTADGKDIKISTGPSSNELTLEALPFPQTVTFRSQDGMKIPAILHKAEGSSEGNKAPAVVFAHGGPRMKDYPYWFPYSTFDDVIVYLASKGYTILSVNFRSGLGYGLDFREPESYGGRGAGDVQDIIAAAGYLAKEHNVDPDRIGIFGHSYGGHHVSNALARSDVFAAGVDSAGVGDWVTEMEKDFAEKLQFNIPERVELENLATNSSAISVIDQWGDEPILFIHGDNDNSAAMQQSLELHLALRRRGVETKALVFPGEDHGYARHATRAKFLAAIDEFFGTHLAADQ